MSNGAGSRALQLTLPEDEGLAPGTTGAKVLQAIATLTTSQGIRPTIVEIGLAAGMASTSHVHYHIRQLAADGFIQRSGDHTSRGTRLTEKGARWLEAHGFAPEHHCESCAYWKQVAASYKAVALSSAKRVGELVTEQRRRPLGNITPLIPAERAQR